ncbi:MAG: HDOD domain-containing protein [Deltaproteobacteria bacterium]|nr:HDOD domain-containing protein [Deltaproteobacteria bacterium]
MKRILFVDDEPLVLQAIENLLRPYRHSWETVTAAGSREALGILQERPVQVVISDVRMPEIDGIELLDRVRRSYPNTARIVLSGHQERTSRLQAVRVAHQFLSKPCNSEVLVNTIERALKVQELLACPQITKVVGGVVGLPSAPRLYFELVEVLSSPKASVPTIARVIEKDVAMCAKLLQVVNSAFFGLGRRITSIEHAVSYLGIKTISELTLCAEVFYPSGANHLPSGYSLEHEQAHALLTARIARRVSPARIADDAFIAGMLHEIGKLVLATRLPAEYSSVLTTARSRIGCLAEVEREMLGVTHAEVGAALLGLWGLPYPIVEAVWCHHFPSQVPQREFDVLAALYIANGLAHSHLPDPSDAGLGELDASYLAAMGATAAMPQWKGMAAEEARKLVVA